MSLIVYAFAILCIAATAIPIVKNDASWIRVFDFPRIQILILSALVFLLLLIVESGFNSFSSLLLVFLGLSLALQASKIFPYTKIHTTQILEADKKGTQFKVMCANVWQPNRNSKALMDLVYHENPDILLAVETNKWWENQLQNLSGLYNNIISKPQENTYGMMLFTKFEVTKHEVKYITHDDVPSIHCRIQLDDNTTAELHCIHPRPPVPSKAQGSSQRDAELVRIGRQIRDSSIPQIVCGDLNDVGWSYTSKLFRKISKLMDPRVGRGMFNTFHAKYFFLRFPLDHIFCSQHFKHVRMKRLPEWGSDHFPILAELEFTPAAKADHDPPDPDMNDKKAAGEELEEAKEESDKVH